MGSCAAGSGNAKGGPRYLTLVTSLLGKKPFGIREREVYEHLPHIALSALAQKRKLAVLPFRCKKTHLETPVYRLL